MAKRARVISIELKAGTATFFRDLDQAQGKIRQFGHGAVSDMQASSAAIRELMGGQNVRAVEKFLGSVLGLGPILRAAFPVVGAVAFAGVLYDMGKKAYDFFRDMQLAPERVRGSFFALNSTLGLTNDQLAVSNARLENEISKLEGKHENTLALTLAEAKQAADQLADSLQKDLKGIDDLLRKESGNAFSEFAQSLMGGGAGTRDIAKQVGGETGFGGFIGSIAGLTDPEKLRAAYDKEIDVMKEAMARAKEALDSGKFLAYVPGLNGETIQGDMKARIETLQAVVRNLQKERQHIDSQTKNTQDTQKHDQLQAAHDNAQQDRPFADRMKAIGAEIDGVKAKLEAIGKPEAAQIIAKAFGESQKAIEEVNKALERHNSSLTEAQQQQIRSVEVTLAQTQADEEWRNRLVASTLSIDEHIASQNALTAAIGKGIDATRAANVEARLMQELGQHSTDQQWLGQHQGDVNQLRQKYSAEFDAEHNRQIGETVQKLRDEIEMERALAAAQADGAEAVRQAALAVKLRQAAILGASQEQIQAEMDLYNAQRANTNSEQIAELNEKIAATERLADAIGHGADAQRKANLENTLAKIQREGDIAIPGVLGIGQRGVAAVGADQASHNEEMARTHLQADRVEQINEEIEKLNEAKAARGDTLAIEIELRDLENQRINALVQESLGMRGARDGVRAFFLEMETDAEAASKIIYNTLNSMFDQTAANLAHLFTGQHTNWAKSLQQVGTKMTEDALKSAGHAALGKLGHALGIGNALDGKADGSSQDRALWVRMATAGGAPFPTLGQLNGSDTGDSDSGSGGSIFSGVAGWFSHFVGAGHASGGPVSPGTIYPVGEDGPEYFAPGMSGSIIPNKALGGGYTHVEYHIDARGADLGVMNRINQGMAMTHDKAVAHAVQAIHERSKRVPNK